MVIITGCTGGLMAKVDLKILDSIIKDTIHNLEQGKGQIDSIAESAIRERDNMRLRLNVVRQQVQELIDRVDRLEGEEKQARHELIRVSRDFQRYGEEDIKRAYERAREAQIELGQARGQEAQLRVQRDELELSLRHLEGMVQKAEALVSRVGVALSYLVENLGGVGAQIEDIQQKQLLGLRVIKAQEEERRRMAREIHDGPAQSMANIVLRVEICEKLLTADPGEVRQELADLKERVRDSLQEVRHIIFDLRPMMLDDLGLIPAIRRYLAVLEERQGLRVLFQARGRVDTRLGLPLEIAAFRIIQEALNNVIKHSGVSDAALALELLPQALNMRISDRGRGFDPAVVMESGESDSFGLLGMRERVELLDGELLINSRPGKGTSLQVRLPLGLDEGKQPS